MMQGALQRASLDRITRCKKSRTVATRVNRTVLLVSVQVSVLPEFLPCTPDSPEITSKHDG